MTLAPPPGPRQALPDAERAALERASELAARGLGSTFPNPVVGCVILDPAGEVVGEGWHHRAGGPHAEIEALRSAGSAAAGGTAVVTLEPCNHTGRTPPCSAALIAAGITRVVIGVRDPHLRAAGGLEHLAAAGVQIVDVSGTAMGQSAAVVNQVWLTAMRTGRPFVTLKLAMTIDGRVAAADGTSRWITSEESRADVHRLRSQVDTMMVGIGTVLTDDPRLTVRDADGIEAQRQPLRVIVDSSHRIMGAARVFGEPGEVLVADATEFPGPQGRVDLIALLTRLFARGQRHVLLEGGPHLAAAALDAGAVDEVLLYLAPVLLGSGLAAVDGGAARTLTDGHGLQLMDVTRFGPDVRLRYEVLR